MWVFSVASRNTKFLNANVTKICTELGQQDDVALRCALPPPPPPRRAALLNALPQAERAADERRRPDLRAAGAEPREEGQLVTVRRIPRRDAAKAAR